MYYINVVNKLKGAIIVRVLEYRTQKGITQTQLANRVGVNQSAISQYETGSTKPSLLTLIKIAKALDVTADALLEDEAKIL
jgi:transcriptional regulator with XRE-family HTH domain